MLRKEKDLGRSLKKKRSKSPSSFWVSLLVTEKEMQMYKYHAVQVYGQLTLGGKSASRDEIPIKKGEKWTFIDSPEVIQSMLEELATDAYGYDPRNWRKAGITPEEICLRYEHPELSVHAFNHEKANHDSELFPVVSASRYFTWIFPRLRKAGVPTETVVEIMMANREKAWHQHKEWALATIKRMSKLRKRHGDEEFYFDTAAREHKRVREMCKLLGEKPPRRPPWIGRRPKREES